MAKAKKGQFDDLDTEYKTNIEAATDDEIRSKISEVAMNESDNLEAKKNDEDLKAKKETAKFAGEGYAEASKFNKMRINYAKHILEARGKR